MYATFILAYPTCERWTFVGNAETMAQARAMQATFAMLGIAQTRKIG